MPHEPWARHPPSEVAEVLQDALPQTAATVLSHLGLRFASSCIAHLPHGLCGSALAELPVPTAAAMLRLLDTPTRLETLDGLPYAIRTAIDRALRHATDSAGAMADPGVPTLFEDATVERAVADLVQCGEPVAPFVFVLDRRQRVVGTVTPGKLLTGHRDALVSTLGLGVPRTAPITAHLPALAGSQGPGAGPIAVVDARGEFVGVLQETVLQGGAHDEASGAVASLGELYWLGLSELLAGLCAVACPPASSEGTQPPDG